MNKLSYAAQQAKLQKDIEKLQKQAAMLQTKRRRPVLADIIKSMKEYDISLEDISAALAKVAHKTKNNTGSKRTETSTPKNPVAPKYQNPNTGETWTGRGKPPRWLVAAEQSGQSRNQFLI